MITLEDVIEAAIQFNLENCIKVPGRSGRVRSPVCGAGLHDINRHARQIVGKDGKLKGRGCKACIRKRQRRIDDVERCHGCGLVVEAKTEMSGTGYCTKVCKEQHTAFIARVGIPDPTLAKVLDAEGGVDLGTVR